MKGMGLARPNNMVPVQSWSTCHPLQPVEDPCYMLQLPRMARAEATWSMGPGPGAMCGAVLNRPKQALHAVHPWTGWSRHHVQYESWAGQSRHHMWHTFQVPHTGPVQCVLHAIYKSTLSHSSSTVGQMMGLYRPDMGCGLYLWHPWFM